MVDRPRVFWKNQHCNCLREIDIILAEGTHIEFSNITKHSTSKKKTKKFNSQDFNLIVNGGENVIERPHGF